MNTVCRRAVRVLAILAVAGFAKPALAQDTKAAKPAVVPASAGMVTAPTNSIDLAIAKANSAIAKIVSVPTGERTFDNTIGAIDELLANFEGQTSMFLFMSYVHPEADIRDAAKAAEEKYNNFLVDLGKNEELSKAVKAYADTNPALEGDDARLLAFIRRDFRRSGMDLAADKRARLALVEKEIGKLAIEFNANIADDETALMLTQDELKGVPQELLTRLTNAEGVYAVTMAPPIYTPIMEHAEHEATRQKMWMAYKLCGGAGCERRRVAFRRCRDNRRIERRDRWAGRQSR